MIIKYEIPNEHGRDLMVDFDCEFSDADDFDMNDWGCQNGLYTEVDSIDWDSSNYTEEENNLIEEYIKDEENYKDMEREFIEVYSSKIKDYITRDC